MKQKTSVRTDKMKQKTSVRTGSEKTAKQINKVSKSEKPKSKLIEDSVSEYSDNVSDNDAPSTSFKNTGDRSSTSPQRKRHNVSRATANKPHADKKTAVSFKTKSENNTKVGKNSLRKKASSVATKPKSTLIEDSVSEGDSDNDVHSTNVRSGASGGIISPKRKSRAVENDKEDLTQENELEVNDSVPALKGKKTEKKRGRPSGDPSRDIVPAPKGKKSKKKLGSTPTEPKRRSQRKHVPPLDFWRGERLKSKCVGGERVTVVSSGRKYDDGAHASIMLWNQRYNSIRYKLKKLAKVKMATVPKTTVYDHAKDEHVDVNLHRPFMMNRWAAVGGEGGKKVPYYVTKTFSSVGWSKVTFGFLDICALEVKTSQYSPEDNIHFVIQKGVVKVTIRRTVYEFQKYDSFIVPCSEAYAIENLGKSNALLSFCTFKVPFFPYQMVDEEEDEEDA